MANNEAVSGDNSRLALAEAPVPPRKRPALQPETVLFWVVVLAHLLPIWAFRYFPTQDGPAHLSSSIILKDIGSPGTRYHEFFEVREEPLPNWTAHLLLAGLMFIFPALIAEKLLLSIYVLGFAYALRLFCGYFVPGSRSCALVGLLFLYNRCLWLGFYNWNLSLALCLFVLAFWLRRRDRADLFTAAALSLLTVILFLTHLVGFLIVAIGLLWFALTSPRNRWRNIGWVAFALVPASLLTLDYLERTGFLRSGAPGRLWFQAKQWFTSPNAWARLGQEFAQLPKDYFTHHIQGEVPLGLLVGLLYVALALATILSRWQTERGASISVAASPARWPAAVLALVFLVFYVLTIDDLGEHGSFLKARLALLPPLLLLGWFTLPARPAFAMAVNVGITFILAINLAFVIDRVEADNIEIAEYTAGVDAVGRGKILYVLQDTSRPNRAGHVQIANPLLHASQYYCLDTGNLNLDNYQAATSHFPLRFRDGVTRGRGLTTAGRREKEVDIILAWDNNRLPAIGTSFEPIFRQGRLAIFARPAK